MKIFNKENGLEKVYVQYDDLRILRDSDLAIPESVYDKICADDFNVNDYNRFDFAMFSDKEAVEFFKYIDWILDYKTLNKMSPYELNRVYANYIIDANNCVLNNLDDFTSEDLNFLHSVLTHKSNSVKNFYLAKYGNLNMDFPRIPNFDDVIIDDRKNTGQVISKGIDPNTVMIYKASLEPFRGTDPVHTQLINRSLDIVSKRDKEDGIENLYNYRTKYDLSDDCKYFIIRYRFNKNNIIFDEDEFLFKKQKYSINKILKKVLKKRNDNK